MLSNLRFVIVCGVCLVLPLAGVVDAQVAPDSPSPPVAQGAPHLEGRPAPAQADKSTYTLFNPTPAKLMRNLTTDRPDKTESPYTVDAGHVQIEMDLVNYTQDHDTTSGADTRLIRWAIAPINFKLGLCNRVDVQTVIETYNQVTTDDRVTGIKTRQSGFGDITSRLKVNLWGNDGGQSALALLPFIKYPTSQDHLGNSSVEGGLILPLAVELPAGFSLGLMTEFDCNRDEAGSGHHVEFVNSVTLSRDLVGALGGYLEFWSGVSAERDARWVGTFDVGLTYGLTDHIQIDAGVNIGLTRAADNIQPFLGLSLRF